MRTMTISRTSVARRTLTQSQEQFSSFLLAALVVAMLLFAITASESNASEHGNTEVLVMSGSATPGLIGRIGVLGPPQLNNDGQVAFRSSLVGAGSNNAAGIFLMDESNQLFEVARTRQLTPNFDGRFATPSQFSLNEMGQVWFSSSLTDTPGGNLDNAGIYLHDGAGNIVQVARKGQVSERGDRAVSVAANLSSRGMLNAIGQIAFQSSYSQMDFRDNGIFVARELPEGSTELSEIVRSGDESPIDKVAFETLTLLSFSDTGNVFLSGDLDIADPIFNVTNGLFSIDSEGTQNEVARTGLAPPGGSGILAGFCPCAGDGTDQFAFGARVVQQIGTDFEHLGSGVFLSDISGEVMQIVGATDPFPHETSQITTVESIDINKAGQIAFGASLAVRGDVQNGVTGNGIFLFNNQNDIRTVLLDGQQVPNGNDSFYVGPSPGVSVNDRGQLLFSAGIVPDGSSIPNRFAVFLYDEVNGLIEVASEGNSFLGSTITELAFAQHNDYGQVVYRFSLDDGRSGIAMFTAIPEPASWVLVLSVTLCALQNRPRTLGRIQ